MFHCPLCRDPLLLDKLRARLLCIHCLAHIPFDMVQLCR